MLQASLLLNSSMNVVALFWLCLALTSSSPLREEGSTANSTDISSSNSLKYNRNVQSDLSAKENFSELATTELPADLGDRNLDDLTETVLSKFPMDEDVDYDSMDVPVAEKLVPDADNDTFPENELVFKQMHERAQYMRIAEVKQSLLSKLRLLAPPNITALKLSNKLKRYPAHILPSVLDDPDMQNDDNTNDYNEDYHAKISTVIQFTTEFPLEKSPNKFPIADIAYFTIPLSVSQRNLAKAILMVYIGTPDGKEGTMVKLCIASSQYKEKPLVERNVKLSKRGHWEHVDISEQVREWATDDSENYGLIVTANLDGTNLVHLGEVAKQASLEEEVVIEDVRKRPHRAPLVKMTLNENESRYKRSFDDVPVSCDVDDKEKRCCRYKFVIDFEQMGSEFDFIIQPKRYLANYCAGTCPTYYLPTTGNSQMLMGMTRHKLQRCCTPAKLKPLEIIYIDDNGSVVTGLLPSMTIQNCHCS